MSERRYLAGDACVFFDLLPDPMWVCDLETLEILDVNKAASQKFGYSRPEFQAMTLTDLSPDADASPLPSVVAGIPEGEDVSWIWRIRTKTNAVVHADFHWRKVDFHGKRAVLACIRDVTRLISVATGTSCQSGQKPGIGRNQTENGHMSLAVDSLANDRERAAADREVQEQEAEFRTVERLLNVGIWTVRLNDGHVNWSDNVYKIYGVAREVFPHTLEGYNRLVHPDDRAGMQIRFEEFVASSQPRYSFEHRAQNSAGEAIHVRGVAERILSAEGPLIVGVVQDVTKEVLVAGALDRATRLLQIAGSTARLGGWRYELNPVKLFWTAETVAIHEEPDGTAPDVETAINYYAPEYRQKITTLLSDCAENGTEFDDVLQLVTARGNRLWVRAIGEAERDHNGEIVAVQGAFQDITAQVEADERADHLSQRLAETLESMGDAFYLLDRDFHFVFLNSEAQRLLRRNEGDLVGHSIWTMFPETRESVLWDTYHQALEKGENKQAELHFQPLDTWFKVDAYCVRDGLAVYFRDVSEQRLLEDRLRQSQKLEAIGQLTGGVAHDFNNLLTVILGNSELLRDQLSDQQQLRLLAEMSATAADRGAELTSRLLAFSRRQALEPKSVDINRLVAGMEGMLRRTLKEDIEIAIVRAGGLWNAELDIGQLEVAILNLAINGRDAMPGGGKLTIETANAFLDDDYARVHDDVQPGQYIMVCVTDSGEGMHPDTVRQAFEPFFTTKDVGKGSGLGLSMVYGFVKQSGGHSKIYSEIGKGTAVRLYFPRSHALDAVPPQPAAKRSIPGGREHILVVEDDELVRQNLVAQLDGLGYRITSAEDGSVALDIVKQLDDIDLLLTDLIMPGGLNGRELAEQATILRPGLKVLFTSGYTGNVIVHHGHLDRGILLLNKPYRRQELAEKVRAALST